MLIVRSFYYCIIKNDMKIKDNFYKNKVVFITGHTGFKGAYMCETLLLLGAKVYGYALKPQPISLYKLLNLDKRINSVYSDIRNYDALLVSIKKAKPDIVIHMAAQPLVRDSYKKPLYTYETNVVGTVNVLEAIRNVPSVKSFINVTTDKVYLNKERTKGYKENEELNGYDPYSNSKSCSELVTSSYRNSFFNNRNISITTCRAGNVIGGGDFAKDRIIPDIMRAILSKKPVIVRNPSSVRPYQHVLEPVFMYLYIAMKQFGNKKIEGAYNIGPNDSDCVSTKELVSLFIDKWNKKTHSNLKWIAKNDNGPHEANFLKLDCSKVRKTFNYGQKWNIQDAIEKTVDFIIAYKNKNKIRQLIDKQIQDFNK